MSGRPGGLAFRFTGFNNDHYMQYSVIGYFADFDYFDYLKNYGIFTSASFGSTVPHESALTTAFGLRLPDGGRSAQGRPGRR